MTIFRTKLFMVCLFPAVAFCQTTNNRTGSPIYSISAFGAIGDGQTINTASINATIRACHASGGGTVLIPPGLFVTGTLVLLSNTDLHLEPGAVLSGSKDTADYLPMTRTLFNEGYTRYGLILAENAENISLSGLGEIEGNGMYFMNSLDKPHVGHDFDRAYTRQGIDFMTEGTAFEDGPVSYPFRPGLMITIEHCRRVRIADIFLRDSPEWTIRIGDCEDVNVRGITIRNNQLIPNSDGIHCTTSRNVRISDCDISVGDDAIIVSGFGYDSSGVAENITVTNCVLSSRSACIRVGYGEHPIRNLVFSNLVMYASNRGIGVFSRQNSDIQNVLFSNIIIHTRLHSGHWWGKGEPIHISAVPDQAQGNAGKIDNIRFSNIIAECETGILLYGTKESPLEHILFDHVQLNIHPGKYTDSYGGNFDLRPAYPLSSALFKHDIPGLYAQYVKDCRIQGFELIWAKGLPPFFTDGIVVSHFDKLSIENFDGNPASGEGQGAGIRLSNGKGLTLRNNRSDRGSLSVWKSDVQ